ncbi:MAG TPA: ComEC/Rec2 family competence protein [Cyclobacteriaceae bacterium]|nr:ComEC/Rec2 family competence protein [Cyclobacteriaceae bacterium]
MFRWIPYAMVRVTLFFVAGILLAIGKPLSIELRWIVAGAIASFLIYLVARRSSKFLAGTIGLAVIFCLGYLRVHFHTDRTELSAIDFYTVTIVKFSEEKKNSWRTEAEVNFISSGGAWKSTSTRVLLYFSKKDFATPFHYGDVMLVRGSPSPVPAPTNRGEFDLQRHLHFKNIHYRHTLRKNFVLKIDRGAGNAFIASAISVRLWADRQLKTYVAGDREQATASALVLGVTDGLDGDLLQAYSSTGAMHVLAVSGLHVSIIYWIILLLGKPLEKLRSGKVILAIGSVIILWIYAFVTGWSPSVLRAVMMFTFVALARPWKQSTNIYNTMAASAFCLLVYDPFFLMSVGFQLSYIAVFGIVFLHPHLYRLWEPEHRAWDEVWKVTSVSIAAQAATFPISLFYFHQFPNYFLVANLLVIPASFVVLVAGLAILPLSVVPIAASAMGFFLKWVIYVMNQVVIVIGALPYALISDIYIDAWQTWLLAAITLGIVLFLVHKNTRWLYVALFSVIAFSVIDWGHLKEIKRRHVTVYDIKGRTAIDFIHSGTIATLGDSLAAFNVSSNRVRLGAVKNRHLISQNKNGCTIIFWQGLKILVIQSKDFILPRDQTFDFVIISNNSVRSLPKIPCSKFILDSSNSPYFAQRLLGTGVHSVPHEGAFQYSF